MKYVLRRIIVQGGATIGVFIFARYYPALTTAFVAYSLIGYALDRADKGDK